ncbi:hypothetical protein [Aeromonas hydrophila]|uniref:hypothetical protein n=1 Tax=Aeromonas hydrophila TaxID=644 RepID=UPI002F3E790C
MSKKSSVNYKWTISIFIFMLLILLAQIFSGEMKEPIKKILESGWLSRFLWTYVVGVLCIHRYLFASYELAKDSFIYKHFGAYADTLFGIGTYGVAGTTSIALLKGLYMQAFYKGEYFFGFDNFDLISMFLLTSFLLFYCIFNSTLLLKDIIFYSENSKVEIRT